MNRRSLLQGLSFSMLAAKLSGTSSLFGEAAEPQLEPSRPIAANDRVNIGIIGPGSRGQELIRQLLRTPGVEIAAQCDVYEPRFAEVNEFVGKKVPAYKDYRELLERKDLDAIFVATTPLFHAPCAIAALNSGRPVYCEKTIGFTPEECTNLADTVARTGQIFQVGHQWRYASWVADGIQRVHRGEIGEPTHVYGYFHRNDNWRREVPEPSLEHLINWRLYRESSGGLLEELGSHLIDITNWAFGEQPQTILGTTSITTYNDGRTVGDNVQAVFGYSKGRRMFFSSILDNGIAGAQLWIYGTKGAVQITLEDSTIYWEKAEMITAASHSKVIDRGLKTGASYQGETLTPYRGPGLRTEMKKEEDPTLTACKAFIQAVRTRKQPFANVDVGYGSGIACSIGRQAIFEGRVATLPPLKRLG